MKKFAIYQLPALLFAVAIFIGSSIPGPQMPKVVLSVPDKILHVCEYSVFAFLIYRAIKNQRRWKGLIRVAIIFTIVYASAYAASDEFHQSFVPGRTMDFYDWLADTIGAFTGTGIGVLIYKRINL
ncbi:MAG TPA: VanZ family protein [Candidatus Kapabacteria bacterium]|nr:VanZ family protein [Candidatus Kapabacteria bacterium]